MDERLLPREEPNETVKPPGEVTVKSLFLPLFVPLFVWLQ